MPCHPTQTSVLLILNLPNILIQRAAMCHAPPFSPIYTLSFSFSVIGELYNFR
jgi:hypothetical protein